MKVKLNKYFIGYILFLIIFILPYFLLESVDAPLYEYSVDYDNSVEIKAFYLIILFNYFVLLTSLLINIKNKYLEKNCLLVSVLSLPTLLAVLYLMFILTDTVFLGGYERMLDLFIGYPFDLILVAFNILNWVIKILIFCYLVLGIFGIYYKTADKYEGKIVEKISLRYILMFVALYIFLNVIIKALTMIMIA
ncbi:hypothetical protein KAJ41_01705 [Candidatus Parcubacteria bacterium]|nr:hypothetical protein [Candidatus Parcubacteria bacterium]